MSNFFGFHGERPGGDRSASFSVGGGGGKVRQKKASSGGGGGMGFGGGGMRGSNNNQSSQSMIPNPLLKSNPNNMTYNGLYNVSAVTPPPLNQKPARRSTRRESSLPNAPDYSTQPIQPILPVNAPQSRNPSIPTLQPAAQHSQGAMSELQAKVAHWKQKHSVAMQQQQQGSLPPVVAQQQQYRPVVAQQQQHQQMDADEEESPLLPASSTMQQPRFQSQGSGGSGELELYKNEVNRTVDSVRRDVQTLSDTVKLLNPGNQTSVIKMVEQQVQQILVDHNRIDNLVQQVQLIAKSQQSQIDELLQRPVGGGGGANANSEEHVTSEELEQILNDFSEEQKKSMTDLEERVKTALQTISDRSHWLYGLVLQESGVTLFETHELASRKKVELSKGTKVQLTYPMKRTNEGTWMKARTVSEDGTLSVSWIPVWTFTPNVLQKFSGTQPPNEEEKIFYLGGFSLC
jgi:hypothetical protein